MKRVVISLILISGVSCLSTVDERWCGPQLPCSPGFFCTSTFHCVRSTTVDGGTGGGTADGGTGRDGGMDGGGGGPVCNSVSCATGCCLGRNCVPVMQQGHGVCGFFGDLCGACGRDEGCVGGNCQPSIIVSDGGTTANVGGPCRDDFECGNDGLGFCIPEMSGGQPTGFPGGYCSRMCDVERCPSTAACIEAETSGGGVVNICVSTCQTVAQCRSGYQCDFQDGQGVCSP